ncbi:peptidase M50 [Campylobacter sp. RM16190]|uniref:peptidase M50 n=1 Tax=Campylobacter sp. RM16190 TaxID=1705727 RepID=UPI001475D462|nr:peptidase M50 [Campylobacter sp. RM16190]
MLLNTFAPPFSLVGGYFIVGILFLLASVFVFFGVDLNALISLKTAGFFHVYLVGFVMSIIIGALYQLTSVILEKAFSTIKFAFLNLFLYSVGVLVLSLGMYLEKMALIHAGGGILFIALLFFTVTYALSFLGAKKGGLAVVALLISALFLLVGVVLGFILILILSGKFALDFELILHYHIYFVLGFVFLIIVGVASVLLPMFALVHDLKFYLSKLSIALFLAGGVALKFSLEFALILIALSVICFLLEALLILKKRVRKAYDYWNLNVFFALVWLFVCIVCIALDKIEFAVFTLTFGFLYAFIVGHLYKIMPFLIWYHYVAKFVGKAKAPLLDDMMIKWVANLSLALQTASVAAYFGGLNLLSQICLALSVVLVVVNVINFFKYTKFGVQNEG